MKLRLVAIILLLSLLLFFGFKKVSPNKNKEQSTNIEQLSIIKYIPENNKLLFISNLDSFNNFNNNEKNKNPTNKDNFVLIKDSILDYLGIDLSNNKLEDIYNNELIISFFENNKSPLNVDEYAVNKKVLSDDIKMMHEFIEFKYFKKVMKRNNNIIE